MYLQCAVVLPESGHSGAANMAKKRQFAWDRKTTLISGALPRARVTMRIDLTPSLKDGSAGALSSSPRLRASPSESRCHPRRPVNGAVKLCTDLPQHEPY